MSRPGEGFSIALLNQSVDRTLQMYFSNRFSSEMVLFLLYLLCRFWTSHGRDFSPEKRWPPSNSWSPMLSAASAAR